MTQEVEHLPSKHKALSSKPIPPKKKENIINKFAAPVCSSLIMPLPPPPPTASNTTGINTVISLSPDGWLRSLGTHLTQGTAHVSILVMVMVNIDVVF
jgi:hypothetical protein